jgi:hypothetical protein
MKLLRIAGGSMLLALLVDPATAVAATGDVCALHQAGPQAQASATLGRLDESGKCVQKSALRKKGSSEGSGLEASAQCKDLSFSYSRSRESACAKHGGVLEWLAQG